jgi:uncharacterized protein with PQ loop repeat
MTSVLGVLAVIASFVIVFYGTPAQIIKNWRRKSCAGLALPLFCQVFVAYTLWALYGLIKPDWFLVVSQVPGAILTLVLLLQFFYYRKK